jgi:alpha-L-fucosidase 2
MRPSILTASLALLTLLTLFTRFTIAVAAEHRADVEYGRAAGERLLLEVCISDGDGPFPVAILIHGGGWSGGDKTHVHVPPSEPFTAAGFTWFSIDYRLAPTHGWPACVDDVRTAVRWVKAHAADYRGDPARIALVGYSAGGHLAAFAAVTAADDTRVQAVVLLAAPTNLEADSERRGGLSPSLQNLFNRGPAIDDDARAILQAASPITRLRADSPPCLMIHGTVDESVRYEQSLHYKARLEALGVPCELITIPGGSHDFKAWDALSADYKSKMIAWLRSVLSASH